MPARFDLPIMSGSRSPDDALKKLRATGTHALVVREKQGSLRILTSGDILHAKAGRLKALDQSGEKGLVVAGLAVPPSLRKRVLADEALWPKLFGRSRARYVLEKTSGSRAVIISRHEGYESVSAGVACICNKCDFCEDSPPAQQGRLCPECRKGHFECY